MKALFCALTVAAVFLVCFAPAEESVRPNVILIMADDLGYRDLGCYGHEKIRTGEIAVELLAALTETLKTNPPQQWASRHINATLSDDDVKRLFFEDIQQELEKVKTDFDPAIRIDYKEITYATFVDKDFRGLMDRRFGKEAVKRIFEEHDAAPELKKT